MKFRTFVFAALVAALVFPSCNKNPGTPSFELSIKSIDVDPVFEGTKTSLLPSDSSIEWEIGDEVALFCEGKGYRLCSDNGPGGKTATFRTNASIADGAALYGLYPYRTDATVDGSCITTVLPSVQCGREDSFAKDTYITAGATNDKSMVLRAVCGGVRFSTVAQGVNRITLESVAGEPVAGKITIDLGSGTPEIKQISGRSGSIVLTLPDSGSFEPGKWYYCVLAPTVLSKGFRMRLETDTKNALFESTASLSVARGHIVSFPEIDKGLKYTTKGKTQPKVAPDSTGMTVKGIVWDDSCAQGAQYVVVSDGEKCTLTDEFGVYYLKSNLSSAKNVFVVTPSEYELSFNSNNAWNQFIPLDKNKKVNECNFHLNPRKGGTDNYTILMMGDPQQMSSRPHSIESWTYVAEGLNKYSRTVSGPLYEVFLGDMVTNEIEKDGKADAYFATLKKTGIGSFHVPGNHDHVQSATNYYDSIIYYSKYFGPYNFAVNIGKVHYIFLDSIDWTNKDYKNNFNAEALNFLEQDLKYVPEDRIIMLCTHCPLTKRYGGVIPNPSCRKQMMSLLKGRKVQFWYGHAHFGSNWSYTASEISSWATGLKSVDSHVVTRCGGAWCCSGEICRDGSPRGFVEVKVNGYDIKWKFKSFDANYDDDCNIYKPGQFSEDKLDFVDNKALYLNIYMWDNAWSTPEWWTGGKKVGAMTKVRETSGSESYDAGRDPLYAHFFPIWKSKGIPGFKDDVGKIYDNSHLFKIVPTDGVRSGEIHFKDRWGEEYVRKVQW